MAIIESIPIKNDKLSFPYDAEDRFFGQKHTTAKNPRIQLVSGRHVGNTYRNNHLSSVYSCMRGADTDFYDKIQNLRMIRIISDAPKDADDKFIVHLRALVWKVNWIRKNETKWYIDRVYSNTDWAVKIFNQHWKKWGKLRYGTNLGTLVSKMKATDVDYADTDTFQSINKKRREISSLDIERVSWADTKEVPPKWHPSDGVFSIYD